MKVWVNWLKTKTLFKFNEVAEIAAVVFEAATDGKDQLRYLAGIDAIKTSHKRNEIGAENFRKNLRQALQLPSPFENEALNVL